MRQRLLKLLLLLFQKLLSLLLELYHEIREYFLLLSPLLLCECSLLLRLLSLALRLHQLCRGWL